MNLISTPLFNIVQQKMQYHSARQAVLAQNVANSDTPNYHAQDITAPDFGNMAKQYGKHLGLTTTHTGHMQPGMGGKKSSGRTYERENTYELNPIGNNVVLEEEMMRVAENQAEYQKTTSIYRKSLELFRIALGRGAGV